MIIEDFLELEKNVPVLDVPQFQIRLIIIKVCYQVLV